MLLTFGQISLVAVISFVIGKIWASNTEIFALRQKAYARFLEKCPHPTEILSEMPKEQILLERIREAGSEFSLFASRKAAFWSGKYFILLGEIVRYPDRESQEFLGKSVKAQSYFHELIMQMRKDSLGLTWFGIQEFFSSKQLTSTKVSEEK